MTNHQWVQMSYVPIEIEVDEATHTLGVFATTMAIDVSQEQSLDGCWFCHTPLTYEAFHDKCSA